MPARATSVMQLGRFGRLVGLASWPSVAGVLSGCGVCVEELCSHTILVKGCLNWYLMPYITDTTHYGECMSHCASLRMISLRGDGHSASKLHIGSMTSNTDFITIAEAFRLSALLLPRNLCSRGIAQSGKICGVVAIWRRHFTGGFAAA